MITHNGKDLIGKYMLGQVPSYASYLSFGCGAEPNLDTAVGTETQMKFEMFRVPISARSLLGDEISFAAEIPFEPRYRITEVGVWSDGTNALSESDSRLIFSFVDSENWKIYDSDPLTPIAIPVIDSPLSNKILADEDGVIRVTEDIFWCNASNQTLVHKTNSWPSVYDRREEGARFLDQTLFIRSDTTKKVYIDGKNVDLSKNSPDDVLKLAIALHNVNPEGPTISNYSPPTITLRFMRDPGNQTSGVAEFIVDPDNMYQDGMSYLLYQVLDQTLDDVQYSSGFTWKETRWVEVEITNGDPDWYIAFDAMRFDNVSTPNPLYVMSGYTVSDDIVNKVSGVNSFVEFRFSLDATGSSTPNTPIGLEGVGDWATVQAATGTYTTGVYTDGNGSDWKYYEFTGDGTITTTEGILDMLILSGGNGGGGHGAGRGGSVLQGLQTITGGAHQVKVGAGGALTGNTTNASSFGGNSSIGSLVPINHAVANGGQSGAPTPNDDAGITSSITGVSITYAKPNLAVTANSANGGIYNAGAGSSGVVIVRVPLAKGVA